MTDKIRNPEDLNVFIKAHALTLELYKVTKNFPTSEKWGLVSQINRASASIGANLMEGSHRNNSGEYRQFVGIANGSAGELKYHLLLGRDLGYIEASQYEGLRKECDEICKMLRGLIKALD
jgi:four helix bundle protein